MNAPNLNRSFSLPRLPGAYYQGDAVVHWTLPISGRGQGWLSESFRTAFRELLLHSAAREGLSCPAYCLMPDHLHLFCAPRDLSFTIEAWMAYWKREFSLKHKRAEWKFQSRGWHHRLRDGESYSQKWLYVQENPFRKGLVKHVEDWPFKGKVFDLVWTGK